MVARHNGIRTERYKLIHFYQFDEWEFYDLNKDPDEIRNEYNNADYQDVVESLKTDLESLRQHYGDETDMSPLSPEERKKFRPAG